MDRTGARGLPRTCARVALIIAAFLLLVPALGQAASITLEWDANSDGITAGYFVYYGTESGKYTGTVDVGGSTSAVVNLGDPNATYYFAVQAYSANGDKSPLSTEVAWSQGGTVSGGTPTGGTPTGGTPTGGTPTGGAPTGQSPTLANPGSMTNTVGQSVNLQLSASDPSGLVLSYSAAGLPAGVTLITGSGVIFGVPGTPGAYIVTVTVTNTLGLSASQTFTWSILNQPVSGGTPTGGGVTGGSPGGLPTSGGAPSGGGTSGGGTGGGGTIVGGGGTGSGGGTSGSQPPAPAPDVTPPTVTVSSPSAAGGTSRTTDSKIVVTGSASDSSGVISVTWTSSRGGSGAALGTSSWAAGPIDLSMGDNIITITAIDVAGNVKTVSLTVTRYVDIQNFVN